MSRRRRAEKRDVLPDPKFGDRMVSKFMNNVMRDGKKSVAERIVYGAFDEISARGGSDAVKVFHDAIDNVKPQIEVRSRRVGGATYQVPIEVAPITRQALAFRWIIEFSRKRGERSMKERLAGELIDCYNRQGSTIKRREDTHRMAEANKAFAHFRF